MTQDNPSPKSGPNAGLRRAGAILVCLSLIGFGTGAYELYQYLSGTTTTATIDHCWHTRGGQMCTGTWSVGGVPHRGRINGDRIYPDASTLDVRAHASGPAYTLSAGNEGFLAGGLTLAVVVIVGAVQILRHRWRDTCL